MKNTINHSLYVRRQWLNRFYLMLAWVMMGFGLFWLGWIFYTLLTHGISGLGLHLFRVDTLPPDAGGGLRNAIWGSLLITLFGLFIGTPIGILTGVYLAEFGRHSKIAGMTRFMNDILLSAPSIVIGLFIYGIIVVKQGHFSGWAGALALSLLVVPVVVRTTENMLKLVPNGLREAAYALGTPKWKMVSMVTLKAAKTGVLTGILLAFARISGETAPLLFTALNNQFFSSDMNQPIANLPNVIYQFAMSPYKDWQSLAWAGALLIAFTVLITNIMARILGRKKH
ncbi:phosphate ABC transporter permease PstA [Rodentibacter ratti]|uniref:Phosphate transport system permease protein PstA n=1 Tax=Rodentibacter ratti TaxID=1906745 RepID=A0A1V3KYH4_9PAST|nr:phosphate ABC transporter permease PstA [Rodentibacter ratti]OOF82709.1 phosphate ABC transporter, permease protein PstA [Rodentibacter ratti]OOF85208.1 phosphate ABC transporter, permease protein PstA [Rodentibacter ratti]OOF86814.1 phosphate ABC transporter, permease protein PstA [Rodentibacter ratti]